MKTNRETQSAVQTAVVGVFDSIEFARDAVRDLVQSRFRDDQIGVIAPNNERLNADPDNLLETDGRAANMAAGATAGIAAGASVGALWAIGIAAGLLPAIGPVIAGGVLASVLASAAGGAAVAGVLGGLIGMGIPEEEARYYEAEFHAGRTLVTVQAEGRIEDAQAILRKHGAYDVHTKSTYKSTNEYQRKLADVSTVDYFPVRPPQPR